MSLIHKALTLVQGAIARATAESRAGEATLAEAGGPGDRATPTAQEEREADASADQERPLEGLAPEPPPALPARGRSEMSDDFRDLLSDLGAEPAEAASPLDLKDREIEELQRNLDMLRPIGDELARVEQQRIAERREWEAEVAELRRRLAEMQRASSASEAEQGPPLEGDLQHLLELVGQLERSIQDASDVRVPEDEQATGVESRPGGQGRLEAQLDAARERARKEKVKSASHWKRIQQLRARKRELESELRQERQRLHKARTTLRGVLRKTTAPAAGLLRLGEVLGLEDERAR